MQFVQKLIKSRLSMIFWLALTIFIFFSVKYLISEFDSKGTKNSSNQTDATENQPIIAIENKPLNKDEILLNQQIAIAELQKKVQNLEMGMVKIRTNDLLPKIILSFVKLQNLIDAKENYEDELRRLEILSRADFVLSIKVAKLKSILQTSTQTNQELSNEFASLTPKIKTKQTEIENKGGIFGKIKAKFSQFVTIRRTDGKPSSDIDSLIAKIQSDIAGKRYSSALENLNLMGSDYQQINFAIKINLQNADDLQKSIDDFYKFLDEVGSV